MTDSHARVFYPQQLDIRDPEFPQQSRIWALGVRCEIMELVAATKETITSSREAMARLDQILTAR